MHSPGKWGSGLLAVLLMWSAGTCVNHDFHPVNCNLSGLVLAVDSVVMASSCIEADGIIKVTATGGEPPYTFYLNNNIVSQTSGEFAGLNAGIYTVTVKDRNKCEAELSNVTIQAKGFSFSAKVKEDNQCLNGDGSIVVHVPEGNGPYTYQLNNGAFTADSTFLALGEGKYAITVKDNSGCTIQLNVTVPHGATGTSWATDILPIVQTNCALHDCHDGRYRPDLRKYDKAKLYAAQIKSKTQDRSMPFDGSLTQDQINLIACWVDDGAPNN